MQQPVTARDFSGMSTPPGAAEHLVLTGARRDVALSRGGVSRMPTTFLIPFAGALPGPTPSLSIHKPFSCSCIL